MDSITNNQITKTGAIYVKETARGFELHAHNHQRKKLLHIGTVCGATYEKVAPILEKPVPSFSLTESELGKVAGLGADFIRIIPPDRSGTYVISVRDFRKRARPYFNQLYGPQLRVSLSDFQSSPKVEPRNPIRDNPPIEVPGDIIQERIDQLSLFQ